MNTKKRTYDVFRILSVVLVFLVTHSVSASDLEIIDKQITDAKAELPKIFANEIKLYNEGFYKNNPSAYGEKYRLNFENTFKLLLKRRDVLLQANSIFISPYQAELLNAKRACLQDGKFLENYQQRVFVRYLNGVCSSQSRKCLSGVLSGDTSYAFASCANAVQDSRARCSQDAVKLLSGTSRNFYRKYNGACDSRLRACSNGYLQGATVFQYSSCERALAAP